MVDRTWTSRSRSATCTDLSSELTIQTQGTPQACHSSTRSAISARRWLLVASSITSPGRDSDTSRSISANASPPVNTDTGGHRTVSGSRQVTSPSS